LLVVFIAAMIVTGFWIVRPLTLTLVTVVTNADALTRWA